MKKYKIHKIKKNLVAIGLTASIALNLSGCGECTSSENNSDSSDSISSSLEMDSNEERIATTYKTSDYALITIDGNTYLTKEIISTDDYCRNYKYYDVNTDELIGQYNEVYFQDNVYFCERLVSKESQKYNDKKAKYVTCIFDTSLHDDMYFNGEYGYGANISIQSIWDISNFVSSEYFTQDEFNYFNSNSESLHQHLISDYYVADSINIMSTATATYDVYPHTLLGSISCNEQFKPNYYEQPLQLFACTKNGETNSFIGYRCSYNKNDIAYNYAYNKLTWEYIYIGTNKLEAFDSVKIEDIGNKEHRTVTQFIELFNNSANENLNDNQKLQITENGEQEQSKIKASSLIIVDTSCAICMDLTTGETNNDNLDEYYILSLNAKGEETNEYINLYNEDGTWDVALDNSWILYVSNDHQTILNFFNYDINSLEPNRIVGGIDFFNDFLVKKGFTDLIQDEYTEEEINSIYTLLNEHNKKLVL